MKTTWRTEENLKKNLLVMEGDNLKTNMMIEREQLENKKKRVKVDNMAAEIKYHTAK